MRIISGKKSKPQEPVDIKEIYINFCDKYESVFIEDFGESGVFIFKALGRKDFKEIVESKLISDVSKQELICDKCVLYPENYDFENCDEAGLPTILSNLIIEKSMLKSSDQLENVIHYCRDKLWNDLDDQITCIIHEAFPEFSIEEIANWDIVKTAEYMVKSEYILHNLRGVPLTPVAKQDKKTQAQAAAKPRTQEVETPVPMENRFKPMTKPGKHEILTPQKLAELQERYPDIDWAHDTAAMHGTKAFQIPDFDDRPVAEIPLDGSEDGQNIIPEALRNRFKVIEETN